MAALELEGIQVPLYAPLDYLHYFIVGPSGSGKSSLELYLIYRILKAAHEENLSVEFYVADGKASHEFWGITETEKYAEFEGCYDLVKQFYEQMMITDEGGDGTIHLLIFDEVAAILAHFGQGSKEDKRKAEEIRMCLSVISMLGRSKKYYINIVLQRYSATIFPASSGAGDNFFAIGLGRLTVDGRRGLFAGEHLENEEKLHFGQGRGLALINGELKGICVPKIDKRRLLEKIGEELRR